MSITKRYSSYIEEQKAIQSLKLNHHKAALNAADPHPIPSIDVVTLPAWNTMTDDDKIDEAKRLCAAVEEKLGIRPPKIADKMAERLQIGSTTYGNYRRGLCVLSSKWQRRGSYRNVREILAVYLNTGDVADLQLPKNQSEKDAAAEKRLADIEDRITANNTQFKSWKTRTGNAYDTTNGKLQGAIVEQQDQRVRLNKAISEGVRLDQRIDFVDKAVNKRCNHHDELIIALQQRLNGLAEANKLLLEQLEATTEPTPDATPWWKRWWSR